MLSAAPRSRSGRPGPRRAKLFMFAAGGDAPGRYYPEDAPPVAGYPVCPNDYCLVTVMSFVIGVTPSSMVLTLRVVVM